MYLYYVVINVVRVHSSFINRLVLLAIQHRSIYYANVELEEYKDLQILRHTCNALLFSENYKCCYHALLGLRRYKTETYRSHKSRRNCGVAKCATSNCRIALPALILQAQERKTDNLKQKGKRRFQAIIAAEE